MIDDALEDRVVRRFRLVDRGRPARREACNHRLCSEAIHELLRASSRADIFRKLTGIAVSDVGADGAVVVEVTPGGNGQVVVALGVPRALRAWQGELVVVDDALAARLLAEVQGRFAHASALPLLCGGNLFGALVLFSGKSAPTEGALKMAKALVDIAATELDKQEQRAELLRSNAELRASREVLERTERLRALGEMSAGISHDSAQHPQPALAPPAAPPPHPRSELCRRPRRAGCGRGDGPRRQARGRDRGAPARLRPAGARDSDRGGVAWTPCSHEAVELTHPRIASKRRTHGSVSSRNPGRRRRCRPARPS